MDTSELRIKMCEKATEIQNLKEMFQVGDLLWRGKAYLYEVCVCDKIPCLKDEKVWLPTQEQLQDMISKHTLKLNNINYLVTSIFNFQKYSNHRGELYYSMEQLWLAFVMKEKYNKVWDGQDWIWIMKEAKNRD